MSLPSPIGGDPDPVHHLFESRPGTRSPGGKVLAAGALCWRDGPAGLELLLVHSARWGDWSWPKGKVEPGETAPACAVREVAEETGARIELGVPLPTVRYVLEDGRHKSVRYWAARVHEAAAPTAGADEIDEVEWLPAPAALERLSRPGDHAPLEALLALAERGRLDTRPLVVVRHAKAVSRSHWSGVEADRPLTDLGQGQAGALPDLLSCWRPERVVSSPWARCVQTLRPFVDRGERDGHRLAPQMLPALSEQGWRHHPGRVPALVAELLAGRRSALLCTHRPVLAAVVEALAAAAGNQARGHLPQEDPWLAPAEILIAHSSRVEHKRKVVNRIHSVEIFRGESV